jgi:hypothetical protein
MAISNNSTGLRPGVCTSTTRPTAPYNGQVIYETDSKQTLVYNGTAWVMLTDADTPPGLELIATTTVSTGSTIATISNCFSSAYTNYRIVYTINSYAAGPLYLRLRTSGGDDTDATYAWARNYFRWDAGSSGSAASMTDTVWTVGYCSGTTTTIENAFDIYNPNVADRSSYNGQLVEIGSATSNSYNMIVAGQKQTLTQYTGFSLVRYSTNTFGGTVAVYGYRKA